MTGTHDHSYAVRVRDARTRRPVWLGRYHTRHEAQRHKVQSVRSHSPAGGCSQERRP